MAINTENIKLGPCRVEFGEGTDKIILETTQGGVVLTYEETSRVVNIDQYGTTPAKEIITGRTATIAVPFAEKDLDKLTKLLPGSVLVANATDPTKKRVDVNAIKVIDLLKISKRVVLIPLAEGTTPNDYVTLYKAAPRSTLNYTYSYDNELITNVTFNGYPNEAGNLIAFGDPDA